MTLLIVSQNTRYYCDLNITLLKSFHKESVGTRRKCCEGNPDKWNVHPKTKICKVSGHRSLYLPIAKVWSSTTRTASLVTWSLVPNISPTSRHRNLLVCQRGGRRRSSPTLNAKRAPACITEWRTRCACVGSMSWSTFPNKRKKESSRPVYSYC